MNKADKSFLFKSSLMAALLVGSFSAHAAGLGKLTVYSAIGQPLNAEVAVTATPEELNSLSARIASHDAFKDAGIEFMPALTGLRFSVVKSAGGQPMLRLTTDAPLNEPFLHFLVELNWTSGRMVREYTFLLDPPEMLRVAKPAAAVRPATAEPAAKPAAPPPAPVRVELAPAPAAKEPAASEVRVKQGDTLSKIARENLPATISLDQMLVALFNKNRDVFDGDNMNRLRAGKILRVPDAGEAAQATPSEARKVVLSQGADFNAYRRRLAEAAGSAAPSDTTAGQQVAGKIKPQVDEKAAPAPQADKLEVSRTETGKATKADGKGDAAAKARLEEELVARDKSLREASERIAQLEKNLENLKKLVELKSQAGAQLQQQAAVPVKPEQVPAKPAAAPAIAPPPAAPVPPAPEPKAEPVTVPVAAPPVASAEPAPAPAVESPKPAAKNKPVAPPPPPAPEPSFVEDNPELVLGGGSLIALLLGYLGFSAWRKKKQANEQATDFAETPSAMAEVMPAPVVVAPALLADDVSILGDFSESGALTSEENVDPVAEADVLMAYGRDGQAEEILLEGVKNDPERSAIHIKLLELYANRKDTERFDAVAGDVRKLSGGSGPDWDKALALAAGLGVSLVEDTVAPAREVAAVMAEEADLPAAVGEDDSNKTMILSASPVAEVTTEVPAPASAAGDSLDFDLDLGTTSGPAQAAAEQAAAAKPAAEEVMSLDFDFDLGSPETDAAADVPAETPVAAAEIEAVPAPIDDNAIDFAFDLDAPAAETAAAEVPAAPVEEAPAAVVSTDAMDFDIDLGEPEMATASAPVDLAPAGGALSDLNIDFDLDLDAGTPAVDEAELPVDAIEIDLPVAEAAAEVAQQETAETAASSDLDMDLSLDADLPLPAVSVDPVETPEVVGGIGKIELPDLELAAPAMDLSLDEGVQADSMDAASDEPAGLSDIEDLPDVAAAGAADADVPDDPEVATKLELAQAYEEMGDREGARELLNEVLTEGSAAQQTAARARLDQLDA